MQVQVLWIYDDFRVSTLYLDLASKLRSARRYFTISAARSARISSDFITLP